MAEAMPAREKIIRSNRYLIDPTLPDETPGLVIAFDDSGRETERRVMVGPAAGYIYVIQANPGSPVKIGFTTLDDVGERLRSLQTGNPHVLHVVAKIKGTFADEKSLHRAIAAERLTGEWFEYSARTEALIIAMMANGIEAAIEAVASLSPTYAIPEDWAGLWVAESCAHIALGLQRASLLREARVAGTGPAYREQQAGKNYRRTYILADIARWLISHGIPFHANKHCWHHVVFSEEKGL